MTRALLLLILSLVAAQAAPADLQQQIREQERQIRQLEIEIAQLRWELEREKTKNSGEPMLLPELPGKETASSAPKQSPKPKATPEPRSHTVRKGENMYRIALRYGLTLKQLRAANPSVDPLKLRIGQKLRLNPANSEIATHTEKGF